jgi:hypothetical protein
MRHRAAAALRLLTAIALAFTAVDGLFAGPFTLGALLAGLCAAVAIHWWHERHPSQLPDLRSARVPRINISAIPVGGDAGGLIFAVGAIAIVILGVPDLAVCYFAALVCAVCLAWARVACRTSQRHEPLHATIGRF